MLLFFVALGTGVMDSLGIGVHNSLGREMGRSCEGGRSGAT